MENNSGYVTNLVNSIIGVSVLAMPFCFKQCGIILGLGLLFGAAWLTYISCSMLATSAFQKRRRTYEYLALCTLGPTGKFAVELSMIGMMLGTCVAFYVVIGDLSNGIITKFIEGTDPHTLRNFTIVFCGLCIALPLGLMKSLSVLSYFGFFSLIFYMAFVVVVILNAVSNGLLKWEWYNDVLLWRPAGVFQCLPIFSLAYACQCQLFIVYDSLEEPSVRRIENIVSQAIKFVTAVYMSVGFFGYTTYCDKIAGNLLVSFPSNLLLDFIKLGFAMSVVLGFPLIIFPCRQSIHTLFFSKPGEGLPTNTYIQPFLFKSITLAIVLSTMTVAIVVPNVETILGLTGATMGSIICFIFPALIFEKASPKKGAGGISKFVFAVGCLLLVVCTYSNLANTEQKIEKVQEFPVIPEEVLQQDVNIRAMEENPVLENPVEGAKELEDTGQKEQPKIVAEPINDEHRHEPANPIDPDNPAIDDEKSPDEKEPGVGIEVMDKNVVVKIEEAVEEDKDSPILKEPIGGEVHPVTPGRGNPLKEVQKEVKEEPKVVEQEKIPEKQEQVKKLGQDSILNPPEPKDVGGEKKNLEELNKEEDAHNKELLEKIKEQHEKQQQLLIEQEELIKKLEEHQDKQALEVKPSEEVKENKLAMKADLNENKMKESDLDVPQGLKEVKTDTKRDIPGEKPALDSNKGENMAPARGLLGEGESLGDFPQKEPLEDSVVAGEDEDVAALQDAEQGEKLGGDGVEEMGNLPGSEGQKGGEEILPRAERSLDDDENLNMIKDSPVGEIMEEAIISQEDQKIDEDEKEESQEIVKSKDPGQDIVRINDSQGNEKDEEVLCLEDDIECWEGKPKSRELKSIADETKKNELN